jgi:hypothetical protein
VIVLHGLEEGQRREALDQLGPVLRPSKTLQQLLGQQWCHEKLVCPNPKQCGEEG